MFCRIVHGKNILRCGLSPIHTHCCCSRFHISLHYGSKSLPPAGMYPSLTAFLAQRRSIVNFKHHWRPINWKIWNNVGKVSWTRKWHTKKKHTHTSGKCVRRKRRKHIHNFPTPSICVWDVGWDERYPAGEWVWERDQTTQSFQSAVRQQKRGN